MQRKLIAREIEKLKQAKEVSKTIMLEASNYLINIFENIICNIKIYAKTRLFL